MDSPDQGLRSDTPGDHAAGVTDHWFVRPDGQAGTPVALARVPLEVRRVDDPLGVVLVFHGELDLATVPLLEERLHRAMRSGAAVVIDWPGWGSSTRAVYKSCSEPRAWIAISSGPTARVHRSRLNLTLNS